MTLKIYLPPGKMTLEHFTNWYPTIVEVLKENNIEYVEARWNYPGDMASKAPGIVMYSPHNTSTKMITMTSVCETHGHLCLYNHEMVFTNGRALAGESMRADMEKWLQRSKTLA